MEGIEAKKEEKQRLKRQVKDWKADFEKANGRKATKADYDEDMHAWVEAHNRAHGEITAHKAQRASSEPGGSLIWQERPSLKEAATAYHLNAGLATDGGGEDGEGGALASQEISSSPARGQNWAPPQQQQQQQQQQLSSPTTPRGGSSRSDAYSQSGSNSRIFKTQSSVLSTQRSTPKGVLRTNSILPPDSEWKERNKSSKTNTKLKKTKPTKAYRGDDPDVLVKRLDIQFGRKSEKVELLEDAIFENDMPLPVSLNFDERSRAGKNKLAFIYTDLEPDDIFAILCHVEKLLPDLVEPPLIVWTTEFNEKEEKNKDGTTEKKPGKDGDGIYMKKKLLATTALGLDLVKNLVEVADVGLESETLPGSAKKEMLQYGERGGMPNTAEKLLQWAREYASTERGEEIELEILIMAPGKFY